MNKKCINFELFYVAGSDDRKVIENKKVELIEQEINLTTSDQIIGLLLNDGLLYSKDDWFLTSLEKIYNHALQKKKKIKLLVGMCADSASYLKSHGIDIEVEFFNFSHWMVAKSYEARVSAKRWNNASNRFLFLGGVPSRNNRIVLLSKLHEAGLLSHCDWSFFPPWTDDDKKWCRNSLSHYSDLQYNNFIDFVDRRIDDVYWKSKEYSKLNGSELKQRNIYETQYLNDVGYIDPGIYEKTLFSLVSEGNAFPPADNFSFLTEKIWRSVANKHPFILVGYPEQYLYAKRIGLKTFENFFDFPNFYLIDDELERLDKIVHNTKNFLKDYSMFVSDIQKDVDHNYKLFNEIYKKSKKQVSEYSAEDQKTFFDHTGWAHLIRIPDVY